jgi:parallel beta-helix repeat protein
LGTDYHIAQQHPQASDDNPGTAEKPFKTLEGAFRALAATVQPGDTIWVHNGLYREGSLWLVGSGHERGGAIDFPSGSGYSRMISIQAYPGHQPVINQSAVVTDWVPHRDRIWKADFTEDTRYCFPVTFADGKPLQQIGGTVRDNPQYWRGKKGESLEDMEPGTFFFDEEQKELYAWLEDGGDPNEHLMETLVHRRFIFGPGLKYIRISGLTLRYGGIGVQGEHCILEDIDQAWAPFSGCFLAWEYNTVANCRFNHNGNNGMGGRGRGHRIIDCETNHNNWRGWSPGWHAGGVKFIPHWHDTVIKGHTAAYNNGSGIWFDARMSNVTIEGCRVYRNTHAGIHFEIGTRGVIKNNIAYENGHRGIYLSNASHSAVLHNVCYRNGMSGIAVIGAERSGGVYGRGENAYTPGGHNVVWGNILVDNCWDESRDGKYAGWGGRPELILPSDREGNRGCISDYNVFFRTGERGKRLDRLRFGRNWNVGYASGLKDWQDKTGWDRHSVVADPLFVNAREHDFRLKPDSPARWMVTELDDSMRLDIDGRARPDTVQCAGPYAGDEKELARIQADPPAGPHRLYPLEARAEGKPKEKSINLARYARGILLANHRARFPYGLSGVRVLDIPFLRGTHDYIVLDDACQESVLPLGGEVRRLHFLFSVENATPGIPLVEAAVARGDGKQVRLVWQRDEAGSWTVQADSKTTTRLGHAGTYDRMRADFPELPETRVQITTWENDNEWLPLSQVAFKLLAPNARVSFLGVTGERTAEANER